MPARPHRRLILLFVLAVLVPCAGMVALSLRLLRQERDLAESRLREERKRSVQRLRESLLDELDAIVVRELEARRESPRSASDLD